MPKFDNFKTMPISQNTKDSIDKMGFDKPTEIQNLVLPHALRDRDILGQAQTGTGKTLAFAIPIIENLNKHKKHVQAFVLTPTRELAKQVTAEMEKVINEPELKVVTIYGGVSQNKQVEALQNGAQIVVGTPGRIVDLLKQGLLKFDKVSIAVLDEVDEMLDMGFYEAVESIFARLPKHRQTMFFSATIPGKIQKLGRTYLKRPVIISTSNENVMAGNTEHYFYEILEKERQTSLYDVIDSEDVELGIVFCRTKAEAEKVANGLKKHGYNAECLHGDLHQNKREQVMGSYRAGKLDILVATNVAARGIDIHGVTHVINYKIPLDAEVYVHRTGRTGRAGAEGKSITFVSPSEYYDLIKIQEKNSLNIEYCKLPDKKTVLKKRMEKMIDKIIQGLKTEDIKDVYKLVKKKIPIFWRGKALAYLIKKYSDNGQFSLNTKNKDYYNNDTKRLFINIGKNHKADRTSLNELLIKVGKIAKDDLIKIDLLDKYSFVNVKNGTEQKLIKNLSGKKFNNFRINVELSKTKRSSDYKKKNYSRTRSNYYPKKNNYKK